MAHFLRQFPFVFLYQSINLSIYLSIYLSRFGESDPQFVETLEFSPVTRANAGVYVCAAENSIGKSNEESTEVNVLCKCIVLQLFFVCLI